MEGIFSFFAPVKEFVSALALRRWQCQCCLLPLCRSLRWIAFGCHRARAFRSARTLHDEIVATDDQEIYKGSVVPHDENGRTDDHEI